MPVFPAIGTALGAGAATAGTVGAMAAATTAGLGASIYGANKQSKAIKEANATNAKSIADTNRINHERYLATRGVNPDGRAVNARLPLWMNAQVSSGPRKVARRVINVTPTTPRIVAAA